MKKSLLVCLLCILLLTACGTTEATEPSATSTAPTPVAETEIPTTAPTEETTIPTEPPVTEPAHSALYIPGVDVEDVILWFNEVSLSAEFVNSGNPSFLQKWAAPIRYMIHGEPTEADVAMLEGFAHWLNGVDGFPGISEATEQFEANLNIYFCTQDELLWRLGDNFYGTDGGVTFWYNGDNQIYDAVICIRTDLNQYLRNSVILEELYNGLGPVQDTTLREDSLIYAGYSEPQELTEIDRLILQLLYHPQMKCGMNSAQCEDVIRKLYY